MRAWSFTVTAVLCVAACGAAPTEPVTTPAPPPATTPSAPPVTGPIVATCTDSSVKLSVVDIETGSATSFREFAVTSRGLETKKKVYPTWSVCGEYSLASVLARQVFSVDFGLMAVNFVDQKARSSHVGWYDTKTGSVVDVTARVTPSAGDFAALPQHESALFDPEGNFGYLDKNASTFRFIRTDTFAEVRSVPNSGYGRLFLMPDGSLSSDAAKLMRTEKLQVPLRGGGTVTTSLLDPVAWIIDDNRVLRISRGMGTESVLGVLSAGSEKPDAITPDSDFGISTAVTDPRAATAAFIASRSSWVLFRVPLTGSIQPVKVAEYPSGPQSYAVVGWR